MEAQSWLVQLAAQLCCRGARARPASLVVIIFLLFLILVLVVCSEWGLGVGQAGRHGKPAVSWLKGKCEPAHKESQKLAGAHPGR